MDHDLVVGDLEVRPFVLVLDLVDPRRNACSSQIQAGDPAGTVSLPAAVDACVRPTCLTFCRPCHVVAVFVVEGHVDELHMRAHCYTCQEEVDRTV